VNFDLIVQKGIRLRGLKLFLSMISNKKKKRGQRAAGGADKSGRGLRQFSMKGICIHHFLICLLFYNLRNHQHLCMLVFSKTGYIAIPELTSWFYYCFASLQFVKRWNPKEQPLTMRSGGFLKSLHFLFFSFSCIRHLFSRKCLFLCIDDILAAL